MAVKTLYVSEDDVTLWEQAAVIASRERRSVSWVVHEALRWYLLHRALEDEARRAEEVRLVQLPSWDPRGQGLGSPIADKAPDAEA